MEGQAVQTVVFIISVRYPGICIYDFIKMFHNLYSTSVLGGVFTAWWRKDKKAVNSGLQTVHTCCYQLLMGHFAGINTSPVFYSAFPKASY